MINENCLLLFRKEVIRMKTLKKLLSIVLILAFTLTSTALLVSADPMPLDLPSDITTQDMNELTARSIVNTYFAERLAFLTGDSEGIASAVEPITNDEALHREALINNGINYTSSTITITEIVCWERVAEVIVEETVSFIIHENQVNHTIVHHITLYHSYNETTLVNSDAYLDTMANFKSASYLSSDEMMDPMTNTGSGLCIIHIAQGEVGYEEGENNSNKYGEFFDKNNRTWCAYFVSWCAVQASISTTAITRSGDPHEIRNDLNSQGRYHLSQSRGGTYTPAPGDLIFMYDTPSAPGHIGIVVSVTGNSVRIIDGNYQNKVCDRTLALSHTDIVGYGNPNYDRTNHSSNVWRKDATHHYKICTNCDCNFSRSQHIFVQDDPFSVRVCRICGYEDYTAVEF